MMVLAFGMCRFGVRGLSRGWVGEHKVTLLRIQVIWCSVSGMNKCLNSHGAVYACLNV
jgi:hypothetical protein